MKTHATSFRWAATAAVTAAALLAATGASAQSSGAGAVFEGRPAMAGAQAGLGAMAGPPQGGIGLQGSEGTKLNLRAPLAIRGEDMPQGDMSAAPATIASTSDEVRAKDLAPAQHDRDPGIAKKQRSTSEKVRRSAQRTVEGAKYGVSPIDTK